MHSPWRQSGPDVLMSLSCHRTSSSDPPHPLEIPISEASDSCFMWSEALIHSHVHRSFRTGAWYLRQSLIDDHCTNCTNCRNDAHGVWRVYLHMLKTFVCVENSCSQCSRCAGRQMCVHVPLMSALLLCYLGSRMTNRIYYVPVMWLKDRKPIFRLGGKNPRMLQLCSDVNVVKSNRWVKAERLK